MGCRHSRARRYGYFQYRESKEIRRFGRCLFLLFGFNSFILNLFAFLLIAATFAAHESKEIYANATKNNFDENEKPKISYAPCEHSRVWLDGIRPSSQRK
ncbi:hypothetical protein PG_1970 [Porphyromonas gingivalis W83]|uniref:Uncharacterized protein n=1 Tax=Porphyromonas gingivalis (strain ATCC BAA-308 / W83) TaxID=242619 RepID=Q7MTI6_PORGI|nr:hypothetical protein PG_1970 [Porphyromonas gingivalis W83]